MCCEVDNIRLGLGVARVVASSKPDKQSRESGSACDGRSCYGYCLQSPSEMSDIICRCQFGKRPGAIEGSLSCKYVEGNDGDRRKSL